MMLRPGRSARVLRLAAALAALCLLPGCGGQSGGASPAADDNPWAAVKLIPPVELARELQDSSATKPLLLHVGFRPLYRAGAIPGSRYVGPTSRPDGLAALMQSVSGERKDRSIVIYCGCCPWKDCPNMKPAARALAELGFKNVRAVLMKRNFDTDWVAQGFPVEEPKQ